MVIPILKQAPWRDARHLSTVAWMVTGLLLSGQIGWSRWVVYVTSRARYAQSIERRFRCWLSNGRIDVNGLSAGLLKGVLPTGEGRRVYVALETTMRWNCFCVIQVALVYRGRAIPVALEGESRSQCQRGVPGISVGSGAKRRPPEGF